MKGESWLWFALLSKNGRYAEEQPLFLPRCHVTNGTSLRKLFCDQCLMKTTLGLQTMVLCEWHSSSDNVIRRDPWFQLKFFLVFFNGPWAINALFYHTFPLLKWKFEEHIQYLLLSPKFLREWILWGNIKILGKPQVKEWDLEEKDPRTKTINSIGSLALHCSADGQASIPFSSHHLFCIFSGEKEACGCKRRNSEITPTLDWDPRAHLLWDLKSGKL